MGGPKSRAWPLGTEELHGGHRVSKEVTEAEHGTNQHAGGGVAVLHTRRERERERERVEAPGVNFIHNTANIQIYASQHEYSSKHTGARISLYICRATQK